jgi:hypothetical protein
MFIHTFLQSFDFSIKLHVLGDYLMLDLITQRPLKNQTDNFKIRDQKGVF